jgi:integrase
MHCDGGGLYLQVTTGVDGEPRRSWLYRYATGEVATSRSGKPRRIEREMGFGAYPRVSLADAREKAKDAQKLRERGVDPIEAKRDQRAAAAVAVAKAMTFDECADRYIAAHRAGWRNAKHADQWQATLTTYATPVFGKLPVAAIDTGLIMRALEPIWTTKPETASRVRGRIESVLAWATVRGFRQGPNPAQWKNHLDHLLPARGKVRKVEHHAALPYGETSKFMTELRAQAGTAARALEFTILTAARTGEALGTCWEEIDLAAKVWTVPAERMKGGRQHRVPLSEAAVALIEKMAATREGEFVFPGARAARPLSNMALLMTLRRMGLGDLTAHGFRSTFRDWAAETTAYPGDVVEMALAHVVGSKVEAAYRRGDLFDKRRKLMEAWGKFCTNGRGVAHDHAKVIALAAGGGR